MKRMRHIVVAALATAAIGFAAAPASAGPCNDDWICLDCESSEIVQVYWRKVFGRDLECR